MFFFPFSDQSVAHLGLSFQLSDLFKSAYYDDGDDDDSADDDGDDVEED